MRDFDRGTPLLELAGQTALVTGASSGLGERFARVLAGAGVRVAAAARRVDRLTSHVNAIAPGMLHSEMTAGLIDRVGDVSRSFPRRRIGDPAALDSTLPYLVAPASEYVTGAIIKVDDGQTAR